MTTSRRNDRALVALSGGLDSTTVLATALQSEYRVEGVGFTYGSKHNALENAAAQRIAQHYEMPFTLIDLTVPAGQAVLKSNLLKSGGTIPEGHYEAESMKLTVVPGRNTIFLAFLLGMAQSRDCTTIFLGIHAGDHFIYADCRPEYFAAMSKVIEVASEGQVTLQAPFLHQPKPFIVRTGLALKAPYHLTRTCYQDSPVACGKCGSCQERLTAFRENGVEDPLPYQSREILPKT